MQVATRITNQGWKMAPKQVEVIAKKGGWTTIREIGQTVTEKVRNGELVDHTEISEKVAPTTAKLVIAKAKKSAAATPRAKLPLEERKNGKVDPLYLQFYTGYTTVTKAGTVKRSIDKGDALALQLRALELAGVYAEVAKIVGLSKNDLLSRFGHLNNGMQRMSLGNMARKYLKEAA